MLARRICNTSFMACRTMNIVQRQSQIRLINVSALARKDMNNPMDQDKKVNTDLKGPSSSSSSSGGNNSMIFIALGLAAAAGGAYWMWGGKGIEGTKDKVAGHLLVSKANKQFEETKETILAVARTVGGKDLANQVEKIIDEAKDMVEKMAGDMNAKENIGKVYRQGKDMMENISEGGIMKYIGEWDTVRDTLLKEAEKVGGKDLVTKVTKVMDEAKGRAQKLVKNIGKDGINANEIKNIQEYVVNETKKLGGDDISKKATQYFEEAQNKLQKMAANGISDKDFEKVKDFVVKEAEKVGGRDLAKKAGKLMDEAKETIEKIAKEYSKHGAEGAYKQAKEEVSKRTH